MIIADKFVNYKLVTCLCLPGCPNVERPLFLFRRHCWELWRVQDWDDWWRILCRQWSAIA